MFFLWPKEFFSYLPKKVLICLHKDCCSLRRAIALEGIKKKKKYPRIRYEEIYSYHSCLMKAVTASTNIKIDTRWFDYDFLGADVLGWKESLRRPSSNAFIRTGGRPACHTEAFYLRCLDVALRRGYIDPVEAERIAAWVAGLYAKHSIKISDMGWHVNTSTVNYTTTTTST